MQLLSIVIIIGLFSMAGAFKKDDPNKGNSQYAAFHASTDAPVIDVLIDINKISN